MNGKSYDLIGDKSLPLWERGLKYSHGYFIPGKIVVAPLVGAWIEIGKRGEERQGRRVAPLVGAWIEMEDIEQTLKEALSLPLWERGLKLSRVKFSSYPFRVAPLVGAWIEMPLTPADCNFCRVAPLVGAWIEIV